MSSARGRRHDPVDHRRRKRDLAADPFGERCIAQVARTRRRCPRPARRSAAGCRSRRRSAARRARGGARRARRPAVRARCAAPPGFAGRATMSGWCDVEAAGRRLVAVALFRDGQRHDPRVARREAPRTLRRARRRGTSTSRTLPTMRRRTPAGLFSIAVYRPSCGVSRSRTSGERRLTPQMPHGRGACASASSVYIAWCARWNAPMPEVNDADAERVDRIRRAARSLAARGRAWQRTAVIVRVRGHRRHMPAAALP